MQDEKFSPCSQAFFLHSENVHETDQESVSGSEFFDHVCGCGNTEAVYVTPRGIVASLGNRDILARPKTAFLCSRKIPAAAVLKCYDWAIAQREQGVCVISAFHSRIEKDVFHYLLAGTQPVIMALARGMKRSFEPEITSAISDGRLLILSPFGPEVTRITSQTADIRNRFMVELADELVIGHADKKGLLSQLVHDFKDKPVTWLLKKSNALN